MKTGFKYRLLSFMLPGLKRWILFILIGIAFIVFGVFLLLGYHPVMVSSQFLHDLIQDAVHFLPHRISGLIVITGGGLVVIVAIARMTVSVLGAYLPDDRESIPDVLYRRQLLGRGPKVVVIGGGTGLSTLLKGIKNYTNNITAIVAVGDDGGSSGRLRQELGVLPPGDIRNCITALADEEKLVTELFRYRFQSGQGLEGHSFGNLFLSAIYAITDGDMVQAVKVAGRVLNSRGQVVPSTLSSIALVAQMKDGRLVKGESQITASGGQIERLTIEPIADATPEALVAITEADLIIIGPGSLYTSVIPNLLISEIVKAVKHAHARKIYVCNVMTQPGETSGYTVCDHIEAILSHAGVDKSEANKLIQTVVVNHAVLTVTENSSCKPVPLDAERVNTLGIATVSKDVVNLEPVSDQNYQHDCDKLAQLIMLEIYKDKKSYPLNIDNLNSDSGIAANQEKSSLPIS
jgi:uncharacterized cofD-like protein